MANEFLTVSNGIFTLSETENKNQFYFYRNDGEVLSDIDREPIDLYQAYIMQKMITGEIRNMVMNNIYSEMSDDGKYIRLTIYDIGEKTTNGNEVIVEKKESFFKRLLNKIFK